MRRVFFTLTSALALVCFSSASPLAEELTIDRILVFINDEIITERDLSDVSEPVIAQYRATMSGPQLEEKIQEIRSGLLEKLVDERLVESAAKRADTKVEPAEVDQMLADVRAKFPSQEVMEEALQKQGMSFSRLRERFEKEILKRKVIDFEVRSRINLSPAEIRFYYDQHADEFQTPSRVKLRQILIRVGAGRSPEVAQEMIAMIIDNIKQKGESFIANARTYSEGSEAENGGDMGWIEKGSLIDKIDEVVFMIEPGQITPPVKTQLGYHIFLVEEKQEPKRLEFADCRKEIRNRLFAERTNQRLQQWLDELRKNAYIVYQ